MKRILTVLLPVILSTYLPMCAVVSLPGCLVDKYIPQDVRESLQYGSEWLGVFWKAYGNEQPAAETREEPAQVAAMINDSAKPKTECEFEKQQNELPVNAVAGPNFTITVEAPLETVNFAIPKQLEFNEKQFENDLRILIQKQVGLYQQDLNKHEIQVQRGELRDRVRVAQKHFQKTVRELHELKVKARKARTSL